MECEVSSARKKSAILKAEREADSAQQQLVMLRYHNDLIRAAVDVMIDIYTELIDSAKAVCQSPTAETIERLQYAVSKLEDAEHIER